MKQKYTFFWSGPFSNWDKSPFEIDGVKFNCGEQYMMYSKAKLFKDNKIATEILQTSNPKIQKLLGRKIQNFNSSLWDKECREIMLKGLKAKFLQNPKHLESLRKVKDTTMVEASPLDRIWGIGYDSKNALENINDWGENRLGKILNQVIKEIF